MVRLSLGLVVGALAGCHLIFPFDSQGRGSDGDLSTGAGDAATEQGSVDGAGDAPRDGLGPPADKGTSDTAVTDGGGGSELGPPPDIGTPDTVGADGGVGTVTWAKALGGTGGEQGTGLALDPSGNLYVTGYFAGPVNLGGSNLTNLGSLDIFLASYNPTGAHRWSNGYGGSSQDVGYGVAVDSAAKVYAVGYFNGTANLGGSKLTAVAGRDIYLASYASAGTHLWSQAHGGSSTDTPQAVAVDPSGNVHVVGHFGGTASFGGSTLTSVATTDVFVAKYTSGGVHLWSKNFGISGTNHGTGVAVDPAGNLCITGYFVNSIDFGGGPLVVQGGWDVFVACFSPTGGYLWSKSFGGTLSDLGRGVAMDTSGNVYVVGSVGTAVDLGGGLQSGPGSSEVFVLRYSVTGVTGAYGWSKVVGSPAEDMATAVALGPTGNVYLTGSTGGPASFGGAALPGFGGPDIFVAAYSPGGVHLWSKTLGGPSTDVGQGVAADANGVYVTGYFWDTANLGTGPYTSSGGSDLFLVKFAP